LREEFTRLYRTIYGLTIDDMDVQSVSWSLTVSTPGEDPDKAIAVPGQAAPVAIGHRDLYDAGPGEMNSAPVYWRPDFVPGASVDGPAIIAEDETSTIVPAGFTATINSLDYIVLQDNAVTSATETGSIT
jgi:N-methylhydantoinase A